MLVLSRKERQRIRLGDSIVVTVVRVSGDKVRLGIEAPADVLVLRDELEPFTVVGEEDVTVEITVPQQKASA
jgi:carbon storage regulator